MRFILPRSIIGMPLGSDWSRHRRAIAPLFSAKSLETQLPHILSACRELVDSNLQRFDCSRFGKGQHGKFGEPHCPFGAGPRICVGYALAQLELVALLHAVLRRYELFPAGPGYPEPREHVLITNGPRESGLFLKLVPR